MTRTQLRSMSVDALLRLHNKIETLLGKKAKEFRRPNTKQAVKYRRSKARSFRKQALPKGRTGK
jgi:hypothetical protein